MLSCVTARGRPSYGVNVLVCDMASQTSRWLSLLYYMYQGSREIVTISFTIREAFLLYQKLSVSMGGTINISPTSPGTGDIDFGPNVCIELYETQLRWSDYYLKGINTDILEAAPVKIFV